MYQKLTIAGRLGQDPEMRYTQDGTPVTNMSVATNRKWTSQDGSRNKETVWFRVSVWGPQAEACNEYLQTGSTVLVEGRLRPNEYGNPRIWTNQEGEPRANFEVRAMSVQFLSSGNGGGSNSEQPDRQAPHQEVEDEIPF